MTDPDGRAGVPDDRGRPGPCDGAYLTAWSLYLRHYTVPAAIAELARVGHGLGCSVGGHGAGPGKPIGRSTYYEWRDRGRELAAEGNGALDRDVARIRQAGTIDELMTMAMRRVTEYPDELWLAMPHMARLVREFAVLAGTDEPRRQAIAMEPPAPPTPDPRTRAAVLDAEAAASRDVDARRRGAGPEQEDTHSP